MITAEKLIQELSGCYFADPQGMIGQYQSDGTFTEEQFSTSQLGEIVTQTFQALDSEPHQANLLISLVFPADHDKPWKSPTIAFTDQVVETLYPVHGVRTGVLTSFQKRNREHSVFQGIELLLNHRRETFPDRPVFCPILANRNRYLSDYAQVLPDRSPGAEDGTIPGLEVINLFGLISFDNPNYSHIADLCGRIANKTINKNMRKDPSFSLYSQAGSASAQQPALSTMENNPFITTEQSSSFSIAEQHKNQTATTTAAVEFVDESTPANPFVDVNQSHPDHLRQFVFFADLDINGLQQLAEQLSLESASPGTQLIVRGAVDPWFYFLLEGIVSLRADDGNSRRIEAGSEPARQPLSRLLPRKYDVTAMTPIKYIRAHQQVLEKFLKL